MKIKFSDVERRRIANVGQPFVLLVSTLGSPSEHGAPTMAAALDLALAIEDTDAKVWYIVNHEGDLLMDEPGLAWTLDHMRGLVG